jgi:hypothetical protein
MHVALLPLASTQYSGRNFTHAKSRARSGLMSYQTSGPRQLCGAVSPKDGESGTRPSRRYVHHSSEEAFRTLQRLAPADTGRHGYHKAFRGHQLIYEPDEWTEHAAAGRMLLCETRRLQAVAAPTGWDLGSNTSTSTRATPAQAPEQAQPRG